MHFALDLHGALYTFHGGADGEFFTVESASVRANTWRVWWEGRGAVGHTYDRLADAFDACLRAVGRGSDSWTVTYSGASPLIVDYLTERFFA
jgi:hypothetical protein